MSYEIHSKASRVYGRERDFTEDGRLRARYGFA
jgi:hypothetical protein